MKAVKFFALLLLLYFTSHHIKCSSYSFAAFAINSVLDKYLSKNSWTVDVINCGTKSGKGETLVDQVLRNHNASTSIIKISRITIEHPWSAKLNTSSILVFDSLQNFKQTRISWKMFPEKRFPHLVHIIGGTLSDIEYIKNGLPIDNVSFLLGETNKSIDLCTSFMFSPGFCRVTKFVKHNRIIKKTMRWETSVFFPKKYQNLHGCTMHIGFVNDSGSMELMIFLTYPMVKALNATFYNFPIKSKNLDKYLGDIDLYLEFVPNSAHNNSNKYMAGYPFYYTKYYFVIPPGEPYSQFEKMFLPFEFEVWIAILVTFSIGFLTIQIISRCPIHVRNFVYGRSINTPTVNFVVIFLTGAQFKIPQRNFARFILILYIMWCLIIRTCYQSGMFNFLQKDVRKPQLASINEIFDRNFTIYVPHKEGASLINKLAADRGFGS